MAKVLSVAPAGIRLPAKDLVWFAERVCERFSRITPSKRHFRTLEALPSFMRRGQQICLFVQKGVVLAAVAIVTHLIAAHYKASQDSSFAVISVVVVSQEFRLLNDLLRLSRVRHFGRSLSLSSRVNNGVMPGARIWHVYGTGLMYLSAQT